MHYKVPSREKTNPKACDIRGIANAFDSCNRKKFELWNSREVECTPCCREMQNPLHGPCQSDLKTGDCLTDKQDEPV